MIWFVFISANCVLSYATVPVAGQCTVSRCAVSVSGSEESHQVGLEEHDHRLEAMNQNMCSAFDKLEAAVKRTNARDQEDLCRDLTMLYYNISVNLEKVDKKNPLRTECRKIQEQEEYFNSLNLNLTSMIVGTDERIQAVSENLTYVYQNLRSSLQTVNRSLDETFQVMQVQLQSQTSALQNVNRSLDQKLQEMQAQLSSLINDSVVAVLREFREKFQTPNETLSSAIDKIDEYLNASFDHEKNSNLSVESQDHCRNTSIICDCSDIKANGYTTSGVYRIYVVDEGQRYYANASCDMTTTNGAWTVFQRRKDGSVDFYRGWNDYATGFGNPGGEFWLGNNFLHLLTSKRRYRLRIDLEDFEGGKRYAEYSTFSIGSSVDKYRLAIASYSGTAGDSFIWHNGKQFTTKDSDNDEWTPANNAVRFRAGWWYHGSYHTNLNGLYLRGPYNSTNCSTTCYEGITWGLWRDYSYSLKTTEMKIFP